MATMDSGRTGTRTTSRRSQVPMGFSRSTMSLPEVLIGLLLVCNAAGWVSTHTSCSRQRTASASPPRVASPQSIVGEFRSRPLLPRSTKATSSSQLLSTFHLDGEYMGNKKKSRRNRKPWHRRVVTKFLRRRKSDDGSDNAVDTHHAPARMQMSLQVEQELEMEPLSLEFNRVLPASSVAQDDTVAAFLRDGFASLTPDDLIQDIHQNSSRMLKVVDDEPPFPPTKDALDRTQPSARDLSKSWVPWANSNGRVVEQSTRDSRIPARTKRNERKGKSKFWTRLTQKWFQNFLLGVVQRRSVVPAQGLVVEAHPRGLFGGLSSVHKNGQFRCDATIHFNRVVFPNIRLSGGGTLMTKRLLVNLFAFGNPDRTSVPRYARPFDIVATNCTLTEDDLWESSCIRNGLAKLLVRILNNVGMSTFNVTVDSVKILPSNKISCSGEATTDFGSSVPFEVRSGIETASRGHILTFPGLEVSLNPMLGFMPVLPEVDLDIGHNARLMHVEMDGRRRRITASATTTVTPHHTRRLKNYVQPSDSYLAQFTFDVGQWVTKIGRFTK